MIVCVCGQNNAGVSFFYKFFQDQIKLIKYYLISIHFIKVPIKNKNNNHCRPPLKAMLLLLTLALSMLVLSAPLRVEWNSNRSKKVPDRALLFLSCGPTPPGINCNAQLENVVAACQDIHHTYWCHSNTWFLNG